MAWRAAKLGKLVAFCVEEPLDILEEVWPLL